MCDTCAAPVYTYDHCPAGFECRANIKQERDVANCAVTTCDGGKLNVRCQNALYCYIEHDISMSITEFHSVSSDRLAYRYTTPAAPSMRASATLCTAQAPEH